MGKMIGGLVLALGGFGLTFIDWSFTTWVGLALMVVGAVLFFWGLAKARPKKKG